MWQDKIKEIIYLLDNSDVNEIDVTFWGRRFRVVKSAAIVNQAEASENIKTVSVNSRQMERKFYHLCQVHFIQLPLLKQKHL